MATTDHLFTLVPKNVSLPATLYATPDTIQDASTPNALIEVLDFDASTAEWAMFMVQCPKHYDGGGLTFSWKGGTDNASTGTLELEFGCVNIADATILTGDLGLDTATRVGISDTPPATPQNKLNYSTTGNLSHANAGSPSAGDYLIIVVTRDVATDTNTGDLQLAAIRVTET